MYTLELNQVANALQTVPRHLSESNVRMLGKLNHFETFEDNLNLNGMDLKRLSLSGSIVVLDLDFVKPDKVAQVSVSLSTETASESPFSAMSAVNNPSNHLLLSLREPRLMAFANMLSFLSKCDRFSTKDINCFQTLDLISTAINEHISQKKTDLFGKPEMNPFGHLGLGLKYLNFNDKSFYALVDILPGNRRKFSLKRLGLNDYLTSLQQQQNYTTQDDTLLDARAELTLTLDPPVLLPDLLATQSEAVISNLHPEINNRLHCVKFDVPRHPRFASQFNLSDEFDAKIGVVLPYRLVEVSQIPLEYVGQIPFFIGKLRQFALMQSLINSLLKNGEPCSFSFEAADLNIGDAMSMREQPASKNYGTQVAVTLKSHPNSDLEIFVSWVLADLSLTIIVKHGAEVELKVMPSSLKLNMNDMERLIKGGELRLALSYAVCSIKSLKRRASSNTL